MKNIPKILVVDDDENLRKMLSGILRIKGYEVVTAETGTEAMAEAERAFVNVALIDLKLPDMSGIELLGRIKLATPLTEAIILTAHASLDTAVESTNKGAFSYLLKPCDIDKLLRHIHRALDQQQTQQEILRLASFPGMNPNPVLEVNAAGVITYLNPVAERLFPELAVAQPAPGALGDISASAATRSGERAELVREVMVGSTTFEQFLYPVPQSDLIRIYMLDATERKRSEEALKKSEARYRSYIELTGQLAWVTGADGAVVEDIPPWRAFTGQSEEQVKGWGWAEALHPDDRERAAQIWREAVERKGVYEVEYRVLRHDGIYRDFFARGVPVLDASGGVREWVGTSIDITERKRSEQAMRESEETFKAVSLSAQDAILMLDNDGKIALWNAAAEKVFGYSSEEALGKDLHLLLAPARFHEAHRTGFGRFRSTGEGAAIGKTLELAALRKNGTEFAIELSLSAVNLKDKWNAVGIVRDITDRKKSEEELKLFRALIDQTTDTIEVLDPQTYRFLDVNQKACLALGYSREELLSLSAFDIDPTLDRSRAAEQTQELRKLGSLTHEGRHRRKDGSEFPVEVSLGYVSLDRAYIISVVRDITERKLAQEALERKERYYRKMIEGGSEVFFLMDRAGTLRYRNESGKQLTGWGTAEVLGKPVTDFVSAESLPLVRNAMAEAFAKPDQLIKVEVRMLRKDGTQVEIEALAKNLLDDPDVAGIVITARDITERKQAESRLAEQLIELQRWNEVTLGREGRILDLKHEVNELLGKSGLPLRYPSAESDGQRDE